MAIIDSSSSSSSSVMNEKTLSELFLYRSIKVMLNCC